MTWAIINTQDLEDIDPNLFVRYSETGLSALVEFSEEITQYVIKGPFDEIEKDFILTTHEWLVII
jgi:hypothetical protein